MTTLLFPLIKKYLSGSYSFRDFFDELIPDQKELDEFSLWAFGKGYENKDSLEIMNSWNDLHSNEYMLKPDNMVESDAKIMVNLWKTNGV